MAAHGCVAPLQHSGTVHPLLLHRNGFTSSFQSLKALAPYPSIHRPEPSTVTHGPRWLVLRPPSFPFPPSQQVPPRSSVSRYPLASTGFCQSIRTQGLRISVTAPQAAAFEMLPAR
ncbi:hypothetical protein LIA77_11437 [Sarocladium implicatum]|nr:hypothetical protein LIA77_11437 [Sarocladium implicatum]